MLLCVWLMLQPLIIIGKSEACAEFYFGSSHYEATFVKTNNNFKRWNELKEICEQSGYQLVSITTSDENYAILNFLQENCTRGDYAIGLSRQMGMPRNNESSWDWESGDTALELFWALREPDRPDSDSAFGYMTTLSYYETGKWYDIHDTESTGYIGLSTGSPGYGYICEKSIATPQLPTATSEISLEFLASGKGQQMSSIYRPTSISATLIRETNERTDINGESFWPTQTSEVRINGELTTPQSPTAIGEISLQYLTSGKAPQMGSIYTSISATITGKTNERTDISGNSVRPTQTSDNGNNNDELDLNVILLTSVLPFVTGSIVLLLLYMFRDRLCCKANQDHTNGEVEVMSCDIYSINLDNGTPLCTENTPGQKLHPGLGTIEVQDNNKPLYVNQRTGMRDKVHPIEYDCRKKPGFEQYEEEEMVHMYAAITEDSDRNANEALPNDPERLYDSLD